MKKLFQLMLILLAGFSLAAEPIMTYEGDVAGIFCSACSGHVKAALMKIEGVESVKITTAPKGGLPRLHVTSTKPVTLEQAVQALGDKARMYHIQSLKLVKP